MPEDKNKDGWKRDDTFVDYGVGSAPAKEEPAFPVTISSPVKASAPANSSDLVPMVSLRQGRVIVNNAPSGATYEFAAPDVAVNVNAEDVPFLLSKIGKGGCCGAQKGPRPYFAIKES